MFETELQGGDIARLRQRDINHGPKHGAPARYREPAPAHASNGHCRPNVEGNLQVNASGVQPLVPRVVKEFVMVTAHQEDGAQHLGRQAVNEARMGR